MSSTPSANPIPDNILLVGTVCMSASTLHITLHEHDVLKLILEYLDIHRLHISQLSLERETGVINGEYSDDLLFLRQLVIDGQWDNALDFVEPLKNVENFDFTAFRFNITKYKYFELLCIKLEPGPMHDNDFAVEELVECLKDLEHISPSPEEYRQLCALLTLPKLSDHADFKDWNPSNARIECFSKVVPIIAPFLPSSPQPTRQSAANDRMTSLLAKGLFYEACVEYCQAQAIGDYKTAEKGPVPPTLLASRQKLSATDLSLIAWLEILGKEQFAMPFQQKQLDFKFEQLKKPKLEAQWTEQILSTPIKPGGSFPHAMVPNTKMKFAEKMMSQSMIPLPMMSTSMVPGPFPAARVHQMSQSTAPNIGFTIANNAIDSSDNLMQQSIMIDTLMERSELTKTSRPSPGKINVYPNAGMAQSMAMTLPDVAHTRRQLDEITRRSLPPSHRASTLPTVPEMSSPGSGDEYAQNHSALYREFANRQSPHPMPMPYAMQMVDQRVPVEFVMNGQVPGGGMVPNPMLPMPVAPPPRPMSVTALPPMAAPVQSTRPVSMPSSSAAMPVQFHPVYRYEDSQAIRAVAFHPTGKYFSVGTNSKQLLVFKYPDIRQQRTMEQPKALLSRPKQHRGSVYCLAFNQTGELLASGSNDKSLRLMAFNSESCKIGAEMELTIHDGTVRDLIFLEDTGSNSNLLVSGGAGNCLLHVTDCNTGQVVNSLKGHTAAILGLYAWSSGGSQLVSCSQDKTIRFWDIRTNAPTNVIAPQNKSLSAPVTSVCVDPSGQLLVSGHEDASVTLYDVTGSRVIQVFRPHGDEVRTVRFSNAAYYLLSASYDRRIVITDMRGDLMAPLMYVPVAEHSDKIIQCRWHPYDFTFLSTSADRSTVLWSLPPS